MLELLERKIGNIETRLSQARTKLDQVTEEKPIAQPPVAQELDQVEEKKPEKRKPKEETVDDKVKVIRDEVLEALVRLEQMDIEK